MKHFVICHYGEIGLKGGNRKFFEEKLVENICNALAPSLFINAKRISGAILIEIKQGASFKKIEDCLKNVFGIVYFSFAENCRQDINIIKEKAIEILKNEKFNSFCIRAKRSNKKFPITSQKINEQVGEAVLKILNTKYKIQNTNTRVDLGNPEITLFIEIVDNYAFFYFEKIQGLGGLPVGVSEKAVVLLSGGIDSPVASFSIMRRGTQLIFVHFTSYPFTKKTSVEKVKDIVELLNKYQFQSKLYLVPFTDIQKAILLKTKSRLRVILYRRFMVRIAEIIAKKEKAKALVTGENIGQVASQTLSNIATISEITSLPILRPLIGNDKDDIIQKAKEIGSFDISIQPGEDCCSMFLPKHPETKSNLAEVKTEEKELDIEKLIEQALSNSKVVILNTKY